MKSRSWQYISCHRDACSNHFAISDCCQYCSFALNLSWEAISVYVFLTIKDRPTFLSTQHTKVYYHKYVMFKLISKQKCQIILTYNLMLKSKVLCISLETSYKKNPVECTLGKIRFNNIYFVPKTTFVP